MDVRPVQAQQHQSTHLGGRAGKSLTVRAVVAVAVPVPRVPQALFVVCVLVLFRPNTAIDKPTTAPFRVNQGTHQHDRAVLVAAPHDPDPAERRHDRRHAEVRGRDVEVPVVAAAAAHSPDGRAGDCGGWVWWWVGWVWLWWVRRLALRCRGWLGRQAGQQSRAGQYRRPLPRSSIVPRSMERHQQIKHPSIHPSKRTHPQPPPRAAPLPAQRAAAAPGRSGQTSLCLVMVGGTNGTTRRVSESGVVVV